MKEILLDYLCCPYDKQDFKLDVIDKTGDEIINGSLYCISCNRKYLIENGIPNIVDLDETTTQEKLTSESFGYEWNQWKNLANYDQSTNQFLDWVSPLNKESLENLVVLDAGCGTGRWDRYVPFRGEIHCSI